MIVVSDTTPIISIMKYYNLLMKTSKVDKLFLIGG